MTNNSSKYISCMRLNGFPILAPIISPKYRKELLQYKQLAIAIEERRMEADRSETITSVEQSLVFNKATETSKDLIGIRVPYANLTCDIQVSQYTNNEFQFLYSDQRSIISEIEECDQDEPIRNSPREQYAADELIGSNVRRNSYTLDNPTEFLINKLANIDINTSIKNKTHADDYKQLSFMHDEMKQSDMLSINVDLTSQSISIEDNARTEMGTSEEDNQMNQNLSVNSTNTIETKSDIINLSSDTETELMNLSFHSSIESHIDAPNNLYHQITPEFSNSVLEQNHELHRILIDVPKDYSTKLLSLLRDDDSPTIKRKQWAANIIVAWSRGHLVRRLLRSAHVQRLVDTIRATLVCAVQLHGETEERIQVADVELHRRLIQQVSAACCDFHDVFFQLPTDDQMKIIRTDRIVKIKQLELKIKKSAEQRPLTTHGRVMALASRRKQPFNGGTTNRRLFPPLSTVIQSN